MAQNFIAYERDQELLLPPDLRDWLPASHLAWFVLGAVEQMDLCSFYRPYRADGLGRPAHDPQVMVAMLLYAYCRGQRSSRVIERECVEDVAHRVVTANQFPDHTTIARFRQRHEDAIAGLFGEVLALCADAGLAGVGVLAVDGTKVHANASHHANRDYEQLAREILDRLIRFGYRIGIVRKVHRALIAAPRRDHVAGPQRQDSAKLQAFPMGTAGFEPATSRV